jgi:hypothetical protein
MRIHAHKKTCAMKNKKNGAYFAIVAAKIIHKCNVYIAKINYDKLIYQAYFKFL